MSTHRLSKDELNFKGMNTNLNFSSSNDTFCFFENNWSQMRIYGGISVGLVRSLCESKKVKILGFLSDVPEYGTKKFEYSDDHLCVSVEIKGGTYSLPGYFFESTNEEFQNRLKQITFVCLDKVTKENVDLYDMSYNPQQITCCSQFLDEYLDKNPDVNSKELIDKMINILRLNEERRERFLRSI